MEKYSKFPRPIKKISDLSTHESDTFPQVNKDKEPAASSEKTCDSNRPNIGYLFYKKKDLSSLKIGFLSSENILHYDGKWIHLNCKTTYPGLTCGLGYPVTPSTENDVKLGFSFDYTTGQPMIPGSSVRGLLRSYFKDIEYIESILKGHYTDEEWNAMNLDIGKLELAIFEGEDYQTGKKIGKYDRDVFGDVFVNVSKDKGTSFDVMGDDYITPHHKNKNEIFDLLQEPTPLRFIKIRSGVVLRFSFRLNTTFVQDGTGVDAKIKKEVFTEILTVFGIGAKTNVGYGQIKLENDTK
jgi:CRISPR-associated protein Cmr6